MQEGVARLVDTSIKQLAPTQAPVGNAGALRHGAQYQFPPVSGTMEQVQQHVAQNPGAQQAHIMAPQHAGQVAQANAAYTSQQVDQFAQIAGVQDPRQQPEQSHDGGDDSVSVLW